MANLLIDFTKGFASSVAPDSLSELKSDADTIKDTIMGGAKTAQDKYREIRQSPTFRKTTDFFFRRSSDFESGSTLEDNDDDFDAGFNFGGDDDSKKSETALDYEGMRNIVKGQVSSMYQIAGKQAEASAMTTSEIITTLNTRTSEILSSLGNVNSSLKEISGKLDQMIKMRSGEEEKKNKRFSLLDSSGNLSLSSIFNAAKSGVMDNEYVSMAMMVPTLVSMFGTMGSIGSKSETAGSMAGMAATMFGDHIKFGVGKDKRSLNDLRDAIDERVHNTMNSAFSKLLNANWFQKIFGNLTRREGNKDYSRYVENKYDRKQAIFDNMTRKTIVDIIPAYLRKITAALTGENYFISSDGHLTTDKPDGFTNILRGTLASGIDYKRVKKMMSSASSDITQSDVDMAQRSLTSLYIFHAMQHGIEVNDGEDFANGGIPEINNRLIDYLVQNDRQKKSRDYWTRVVEFIVMQLQNDKTMRNKFAQVIRSRASSVDKSLINYGENATSTLDIGPITEEMKDTVIGDYIKNTSGTDDRTYNERIKAGEMKKSDVPEGVDPNSRPSDQALEKARRERIKQQELVGSIGKSFKEISNTTIDYVASIFHLLNRGINVYGVQRNGPFEKMGLKKANDGAPSITSYTTTNETQINTTVVNGADAGGGGTAPTKDEEKTEPQTPLEKGMEAAKNLVKNPMGVVRNEWEQLNSDASNLYQNAKNEAQIRYNKEMAMHQIRKDDEVSEQDKQIAAAVLAAMQAGVTDGETSEDMGPLMEQVSKIENQKLKSRITNVVQGTLKRSDVKKPAQSKIGKILLWGFGLAKKFIGGILSKAKTFITTIGKKFLGPLAKSLGKNVQGVYYGAKAVKEGFFGSEESVGLFGRLKSDKPEQQTETAAPVETPAQKQEKQEKQEMKKKLDNIEKTSKIAAMMATVKDKINQNSAVQWFKNTEFGQGFMSAFERPKELKEETVADKATKDINDILNDKKGAGVFGTIIDSITGIGKKFEEAVDKLNTGGDESDSEDDSEVADKIQDALQTEDEPEPTMPSVEGETPSIDTATANAAATTPNTTGTGQNATQNAAGGKKKGLGFDFGKIMGGMFSIGGNIVAAIVKVITSLEAFKAMMSMFNKALTAILKPLNKAFQALTKALKPVMKTITKVLKTVVEYVVQIVESVVTIMQPILEAIGPLIEQIFKVLEPILKVITDVVDQILAPIMGIFNAVLVPVINTIAATLNIVSGVIEVGFGLVLTVLGGVYTVVGGILKFLTFGFADSQYKMGKQMMQTGQGLMEDGKKKLNEGLNSLSNVFTTPVADETDDLSALRGKAPQRKTLETTSPMDGLYGSGDAALDSVYGGYGAQGRYGNFMNMTQRGCGPVALADMYSRRSGGAISATGLTSAMASSGTYNPSMGTSVTGYMNTANAMGMHLTAGGVTPASLKQASPSNPITVIGSGSDFSTRSGNNHYMNVIGSSGSTAFVSNPLSGRVERRPISGLASSSVVGLYGSGNAPGMSQSGLDYVYGSGDMTEAFGEAIQDTLSSLKELVGGIVSMFTGDSDTEAAVKQANQEKEYEMAMQNQGLAGLDEAEAKFKAKVFAKGESGKSIIELAVPRWANESDADYQKRLEKTYEKNKIKYLTIAMNADLQAKAKLAAGDGEGTLGSVLKDAVGEDFAKAMDEMYQNVSNAGSLEDLFRKYSSGYAGEDWEYKSGFYSDNGSPLYMDRYTPTVFNNNDGVNWSYPDGNVAPNIPLMEWFKNNVPGIQGVSGAFARYGPPADSLMQGLAGDTHAGADFFGPKGTKLVSPVYGTIIATTDESTGGSSGNSIVIRDWGNAFHIFSHLDSPSSNPVGTDVYGGDELGSIGQSGTAKYPHLHWQIQSDQDGNSGTEIYNPFTFFNYYELEKAAEELGGESAGALAAAEASGTVKPQGITNFTDWMNRTDNFSSHISEFEGSKFHDWAVKAGLTPQQEAYIASVALQIDGGRRLFGGDVALVQDGRFGLANWSTLMPNGSRDTSYGNSVQDQMTLGFMRNYFQKNPANSRAYVSNVDRYGRALATVLGADLKKGEGTQWGTYLNTDLLEGTGHGVGTAVLSDWNYTNEQQLPLYGAYLGDAARYYNWMIDKGYIVGENTGKTSLGEVVDSSDLSVVLDADKRVLTQELIDKWNSIYDEYYAATDVYYNEDGSLISDWTDDSISTAAESSARGDSSSGVPHLYSLSSSSKMEVPDSIKNQATYAVESWKKTNGYYTYNPVGQIGKAKNKDGKYLFDYILLDKTLYERGITYNATIRDQLQESLKKFGDDSSYTTETSDGKIKGYRFNALRDPERLLYRQKIGGDDVYMFVNRKTMSLDASAYLYGASTSGASSYTSKAAVIKNSSFKLASSKNVKTVDPAKQAQAAAYAQYASNFRTNVYDDQEYKYRLIAAAISNTAVDQIESEREAVSIINASSNFDGYEMYFSKVTSDGNVHLYRASTVKPNAEKEDVGIITVSNGRVVFPSYSKYTTVLDNKVDKIMETAQTVNENANPLVLISNLSSPQVMGSAVVKLAEEMSQNKNPFLPSPSGDMSHLTFTDKTYNNSSAYFGSGDIEVPQLTPGWNKSFSESMSTLFSDQSLADNTPGAVINSYNVTRSSDDVIQRLTSNTYNIRSEKIESMLTGMLTLMRERRQKASQPKKTVPTRSRNQNRDGIFTDEAIPKQIERLSVG